MKKTIIITGVSISLLLLSWYLITYKKRKQKSDLRKKVLADSGNYKEETENIVNSISKSRSLYKSLIIKVHPDRFTDGRKEIAEQFTSKLTENKRNYKKLLDIQLEINKFLNGNL